MACSRVYPLLAFSSAGSVSPLPNLWPAPHPGTQFRRESEKTVVRIFCFCGLLGFIHCDQAVRWKTRPQGTALWFLLSWEPPTCLPELDRVAYLGSLLGVPSMLFLLVQSGRVGCFLCCCYRHYGRSPISPFRGWANGKSGMFSLNLGRSKVGGVRNLRWEEGGTGTQQWRPKRRWEEVSAVFVHAGCFSASKCPQAFRMDGEALEPKACREHSSAFVMASPLVSGSCSQTSPCLVTLWPSVPPEHTWAPPTLSILHRRGVLWALRLRWQWVAAVITPGNIGYKKTRFILDLIWKTPFNCWTSPEYI